MKYWFLEDLSRLSSEKENIEKLYSKVDWLKEIEWILENELSLRAKIIVHGHTYGVELKYHAYFPSTPPTVTPLDKEINWSEHQYTSGTLCLEWGPDNWHPSITGAQMLESTYRLIYAENPYGQKQSKILPSRHFLTQGQELRNKSTRIYVGKDFFGYLSELRQNEVFNVYHMPLVENETCLFHPLEVRKSGVVHWTSTDFPDYLKSKELYCGIVINTNLTSKEIKDLKTLTEIKRLYEGNWHENLSSIIIVILFDKSRHIHALISFDEDEKLFKVPTVADEKDKKRLPNNLEILKNKKIGIVGLGSLGSKVSISLARMGVRDFYLVDDDLFLSGNIERHTLDWRSVGSHKVDAVKGQLLNLSSQMKVRVSRTNVSGQEATSSLNSVLLSLSDCDLILDATANPKVFNYLSAVSATNKTPMVWGEIFAGGIGGLIARSRPGLDPEPLTMRALFNRYTQKLPKFSYTGHDERYLAETDEGQVMIASDADVSVIASHISRFVSDSLAENAESIFPYSMYLIGMSNSWIFEAPFDTRPIKTSGLMKDETSIPKTEESEKASKAIEFLQSLLGNRND